MRKNLFLLIMGFCLSATAQTDTIPDIITDTMPSIIQTPDTARNFQLSTFNSQLDTTRTINYWNITQRTGEILPARPDTFLTDYFHRTNVEGQSVAMAYLGSLGLPGESRVFFERADRSNFLFEDVFSAYRRTASNYPFINTKIPRSNVAYQRAGSRLMREERFSALLNSNFGKNLNVGLDFDYLYARGFYQSQSARHVDFVFFGNYLSDRHQVHLFINSFNYTNAENGGITDDDYISHPDYIDAEGISTRDIPMRLSNGTNTAWNRQEGMSAYLNYHYNLGFERPTEIVDEEGDTIHQFIPVSSVIYTFDYRSNKKNFYGDSTKVAEYYKDKTNYFDNIASGMNDSTDYYSMSNTVALSLREGFSRWAKFDLTAFLTYDFRQYTMMSLPGENRHFNQSALFVGGELAKRTGKIFRYHAEGSFGVLGDNLGDLNLSGTVETRIPVWGDTASIQADAFLKNLEPAFYENHYRSRYFWWDNDFAKIKKVYIGGKINIPHTKTAFTLGVENLTNYIYFDSNGLPKQTGENIQIIGARLDQNFQWKALHWDNQIVYQLSSRPEILPLPDLAAYSSLYIQFKIAKVLTVQMGANAHYWTKYYAPSYEPATQQFKLQNEVKVGNYPLIGAFLNCHLKQTRFFLEYYNVGAMLLSPPGYFSLPHYPVNPPVLQMGLSVDFIN